MTSDHGAGWHADPTGRFPFRFFDGQRWTDNVYAADGARTDPLEPVVPAGPVVAPAAGHPAPAGPVAASAPAAGNPAPVGSPARSTTRGWIIAGVVAAVVVAVVLVVTLGGSKAPSAAAPSGGDSATSGDFCTDVSADWIRIRRAWQAADAIVLTGAPVTDWASDKELLSSTSTMVAALDAEAPTRSHDGLNFHEEFGTLATYLQAAAGLAGASGGTESERAVVGRQGPEVGLTQVDTELTVINGMPGSIC